jgi:hypothetical protein
MMLAAEHARQAGAFAEANYALMKAHFQARAPEQAPTSSSLPQCLFDHCKNGSAWRVGGQ